MVIVITPDLSLIGYSPIVSVQCSLTRCGRYSIELETIYIDAKFHARRSRYVYEIGIPLMQLFVLTGARQSIKKYMKQPTLRSLVFTPDDLTNADALIGRFFYSRICITVHVPELDILSLTYPLPSESYPTCSRYSLCGIKIARSLLQFF